MLLQNVRHDFKNGILKKRWFWLAVVLFTILSCFDLYRIVGKTVQSSAPYHITWIEYVLNIFKGMKIYNPQNTKFELPYMFILFYFFIALFVGNYANKDLNQDGINILVRTKSRILWMVSKYIWVITGISMAFLIVFLLTFLLSCFFNEGDIVSLGNIMGDTFSNVNTDLCTLLILPYLTAISVSMLQIIISLFLHEVIGMIVVMGLWIVSAFATSDFLIGNYAMLLRNEAFTNGAIQSGTGIIVNCMIIAVCMTVGVVCIRKKDIGI